MCVYIYVKTLHTLDQFNPVPLYCVTIEVVFSTLLLLPNLLLFLFVSVKYKYNCKYIYIRISIHIIICISINTSTSTSKRISIIKSVYICVYLCICKNTPYLRPV